MTIDSAVAADPPASSNGIAAGTVQTADDTLDPDDIITPTAFFQPQPPLPAIPPPLTPQLRRDSEGRSRRIAFDLFSASLRAQVLSRLRGRRARRIATGVAVGIEAGVRVTTDGGNLIAKSSSNTGVARQQKSPAETDNRAHSDRVGRLPASGSHWVPARIDLDTVLSRIDSRAVSDILVVKGPYSAVNGPGFSFLDFEFLKSPRFNDRDSGGSTRFEYQTNGEHVYGRQNAWVGDRYWGARVGYGRRTATDYVDGRGRGVAGGFQSGDLEIALGFDLRSHEQIEINALRVDQTDLELPGQVFDIDDLVTDAIEVEYTHGKPDFADRVMLEAWVNRTRFDGSSGVQKQSTISLLGRSRLTGETDVESLSAGYRAIAVWEDRDDSMLQVGTDLRFVDQELNEVVTYRRLGSIFLLTDVRSPLPRSHSTNPGVFAELTRSVNDHVNVTCGGRVDMLTAELGDDPDVASTMLGSDRRSLSAILGTTEFDRDFPLASVFTMVDVDVTDELTLQFGAGHAQRAPSLTELYIAESFMFLLQNGLNSVTGNPRLDKEQIWQIDAGLRWESERVRARLSGFYAWLQDYITFEATGVLIASNPQQVQLRYVNTGLATLSGFESETEVDLNPWWTGFATAGFVEGRNRDRPGGAEPLPGISPLESRFGLRLHDPDQQPRWSVELSARVVDNQDRVATSLFESTTPGFTVWDARTWWQATDDLLLIAGVENFTDKAFGEHLDFRLPPLAGSTAARERLFQPGVNFYAGGELRY